MISKKIFDAFNDQLNAEFYSAYLYLSMSAYLSSQSLAGYAQWMRVQVKEEYGHAMKFYEHIIARNGRVLLKQVKSPPTEWDGPLAVAEATCQHERKVTGLISSLMELAGAESDTESQRFLQWFVDEQLEEEESVGEVLENIKAAGDDQKALAQADTELSKRDR